LGISFGTFASVFEYQLLVVRLQAFALYQFSVRDTVLVLKPKNVQLWKGQAHTRRKDVNRVTRPRWYLRSWAF